MPSTPITTSVTQPGRRPVQQRAVQRRDDLLDAALDELRSHGAARLRTTEVAKRCGVPVASLYQYFPTRQALLASLAERELSTRSDRLRQLAAGTRGERWSAFEDELRSYLRSGLDPAIRELLYAMQADPELRRLDAQDTRANARWLAAQATGAGQASATLVRRFTLVIDLAGALALRLPDVQRRDRATTIEDFIAMARALLGQRAD